MLMVFSEKRLAELDELPANQFQTVKADTLNEFLYRPVLAGLWKQHELWDGTYDLDDLIAIHEMLDIKAVNDYRASIVNNNSQ